MPRALTACERPASPAKTSTKTGPDGLCIEPQKGCDGTIRADSSSSVPTFLGSGANCSSSQRLPTIG